MFSLNIFFACFDAENLNAVNNGADIHSRRYDTAVFSLAKYFEFSERCSQIHRHTGCCYRSTVRSGEHFSPPAWRTMCVPDSDQRLTLLATEFHSHSIPTASTCLNRYPVDTVIFKDRRYEFTVFPDRSPMIASGKCIQRCFDARESLAFNVVITIKAFSRCYLGGQEHATKQDLQGATADSKGFENGHLML